MHPLIDRPAYGLLLAIFCPIGLAGAPVHHDLEVVLHPAKGTLEVQDTIILSEASSAVEFELHRNLKLRAGPGVTLTPRTPVIAKTQVPVQRYRATLSPPGDRLTLRYSGPMRHPLQRLSQEYGDNMSQTPGLISPQGTYLSAASYWFPVFGHEKVTFSLRARLPAGWRLVSQGQELTDGGRAGWREEAPQDDIYLVAAPYRLYRRQTPVAEAMVFLRRPDPEIAARYLTATGHYLELYSRLLGPYPYAKFALVENFWESGYGMPSFTLLGPAVIRLPFILHTSYPHEILHNWWGNGVYPDYASGNWSEGLTSYLADHLLREQRGKGAEYRRTTLQRYADFAAGRKEFPLTAFRGRHGQASQTVGYGKAMMFFHMLRQRLGDRPFIDGLRRFYRDNRFRMAGYEDLQHAFEAVSGTNLAAEFRQWTTRTGAPALWLDEVRVHRNGNGFHLSAKLHQTQPEPPFQLRIPILIQLEGERTYRHHLLSMAGRETTLELDLESRPLRLKVDPGFDLFRHLSPSEIPSSLGQLFGAGRVLIVLPTDASPAIKEAYRRLADSWATQDASLEIIWDNQLDALPADRTLWLFGRENRLHQRFLKAVAGKPFSLQEDGLSLGNRHFSSNDHSFILTAVNPAAPERTIGWLAAHSATAIPILGRKLPHYMKYSYLVFQGDSAKNSIKGQWPLSQSALSITLPGGEEQPDLPLTPRPPLSAILDEVK